MALKVVDSLLALLGRPWFYYVTLLALQLKRIWGVWTYKDLNTGDTCAYFVAAADWFFRWKTNFAWSPLYTAFYGTFLYVTPDAAAATALHRVAIVLAATALVLAVLRRMLPAEIAWLVGAWWAVLPINFNTVYEVHLFALLPLLVAALLVTSRRGAWARGAALAVLVLDMFTLRNEVMVAVACLAVVCLGWERRQWRAALPPKRDWRFNLAVGLALLVLFLLALGVRQNGLWLLAVVAAFAMVFFAIDRRLRRSPATERPVASWVAAYVVPVCVAVALSGFFYQRSISKRDSLRRQFHLKHTVNMGQVYAFGYQQRHPRRWQDKNPWLDFPELCSRQFGVGAPTLAQMIRSNPRETMRHFLWNCRLTPAGVQLMLFNGISGDVIPDYDGATARRQRYVLVLSIVAITILVIAAVLAVGNKDRWRPWFAARGLEWLALLCVAAPALLVIPTQRPRPSYLFALAVLLMSIVGTAAYVIVRTFLPFPRLRALLPVAMVLLAVFVPSYWGGARTPGPSSMSATYARLKPFQSLIDQKDRVFVVGGYAPFVHNYLGFAHGRASLDYDLFDRMTPDMTLAQFLDAQQVTLMYLDLRGWLILEDRYPGLLREFLLTQVQTNWQMIAAGQEDERWADDDAPPDRCKWALFLRITPGSPSAPLVTFDPFPGTDAFEGWLPVSGIQAPEGPYPRGGLPVVRWARGPASRLVPRDPRGGRYRLELCGMTPFANQKLVVKVDGKEVTEFDLPAGAWPEKTISLDLPPGRPEIELSYPAWTAPAQGEPVAVLFRQLRLVREEQP